MMFKQLVFVALAISGTVAQTVDVQFYSEDSCDNVGASCNNLPSNDCCGSNDFLWTSISTDNWQNVAAGTEVRVHAPQNNNFCAIFLANIEEGECLISETPDIISGAAFINGSTRKRRGTAAATAAAAAAGNCTSTRPFDEYFYQPGDGFRYIIDAKDTTHSAAFSAATTTTAKAKYIMDNFDKKVAVKAPTKLVFVALSIAGIVAQTVDVQFYSEDNCDNVGATCNGLGSNVCCGSSNFLWTSISTLNWQNVAAGTEVRVHSLQNTNFCGVLITDIEEGECLVTETPDIISGAAFINGSTRKRRGTADAAAAVAASGNCTEYRSFDEYFYQPGDGFRYSIDAKDSTHSAAFDAADGLDAKAKYIMSNFDKKVAVKAPTKVVHSSA
ncbi:hypothetical protein CVT26_000576 [Gymnopilus dilepis]|uniref:Uncharacterized protein n=1 Tax=Gymnopilus dilepis TaxID=231916 RepID=A0A409VH87_9AGAR|nr:hypothetical protein CVT26_000576 [Gymnopilus dilepis]